MRRLRGVLRARTHSPGRADAGTTLIEQLVAMGIFMLVAGLFMSAVLSMTTSTNRTQNRGDATDAVRAAFLKLDRQVRYANAINLPGRGSPSGDWYVEFRSPQTLDPSRANPTADLCTQWRYDVSGGALLVRTWNDGATPTATWTRVTAVAPAPTTAPFTVARATDTTPFQQLSVKLSSTSGRGATAGSAGLSTSFVARNSSSASPSNADADGNGVSDVPVCSLGDRP